MACYHLIFLVSDSVPLTEPSEIKEANLWDRRGQQTGGGGLQEKNAVISKSLCMSKLPFTGNRRALYRVRGTERAFQTVWGTEQRVINVCTLAHRCYQRFPTTGI